MEHTHIQRTVISPQYQFVRHRYAKIRAVLLEHCLCLTFCSEFSFEYKVWFVRPLGHLIRPPRLRPRRRRVRCLPCTCPVSLKINLVSTRSSTDVARAEVEIGKDSDEGRGENRLTPSLCARRLTTPFCGDLMTVSIFIDSILFSPKRPRLADTFPIEIAIIHTSQ